MDKQLEIMYQSSTCIKYIKGELDKVYNMCINQSTIKRSNQLYEKALAQAKKEVFDNIKKLSIHHENDNIADPIHLDLTKPKTWFNLGKHRTFSAIFCINIFQVAPISIADGMMECAANLLDSAGFLLIYGPFQMEGAFTTDSNKEFHETLSSAGVSEWGLKDVADLKKAAANHGLELKEQIDMPANNFSLIFGRK